MFQPVLFFLRKQSQVSILVLGRFSAVIGSQNFCWILSWISAVQKWSLELFWSQMLRKVMPVVSIQYQPRKRTVTPLFILLYLRNHIIKSYLWNVIHKFNCLLQQAWYPEFPGVPPRWCGIFSPSCIALFGRSLRGNYLWSYYRSVRGGVSKKN